MQEAEAALNSLDKASLGELKSFGSPAAEIVQVLAACMVLCASGGIIPKDLRWAPLWLGWEAASKTEFGGSHRLSAEGSRQSCCATGACRRLRRSSASRWLILVLHSCISTHPCSWNAGKKFMGNVDAFLKSLLNFDKDNVPGGWVGGWGWGVGHALSLLRAGAEMAAGALPLPPAAAPLAA